MSDNEILEYITNNCDKKIVDYESCELWLVISFENENAGTIFMKHKQNRRGSCVRPFTPEEQKEYLVKRCNTMNRFWKERIKE